MGEQKIATQRSTASVFRKNSTWLTLIVTGAVLFGIPRVETTELETAATAFYAVAIVIALVLLVSAVREFRERL